MAFTIEINSVAVSKPTKLSIKTSLDKWAGSYDIEFRDKASAFGLAVGNEIIVEQDASRVFGGIIQKFERKGSMTSARGLDFTALLTKVYANQVYFNETIENIVTDLITTNTPNITLNNLYTTATTSEESRFRNVQLFKALQELNAFDRTNFFVDKDKDLNFKVLGNVSSGITLEHGVNIITDSSDVIDDKMANKVRITGGREDYQKTESFAAGASQTEKVLAKKPVSMRVTVDGTEQTGFKEGMATTANFDYFFTTDNKTVTWNVAFSGGEAVVVEYTYQTPVIVDSQDDVSITAHDTYGSVIYNETINKKADAQVIIAEILAKSAEPITVGDITTRINFTANLGETVTWINPDKGINGEFIIVGLDHNIFGGMTTTTYHVATLSKSMLEILSEIISRLEALEELQRGEVDILSLLRQFVDNAEVSDDPPNNLVGKTRAVNTTNTWYFGKPPRFDDPIKFGGGSGKYGAQVFENISS